jgi:DNA-binding PucR family transcriptional regulator
LLLHASPRHARALAEAVYGPLTEELARTLSALVEHGFDKSAAAAALPVHRNTLNYRVARIEERTGLDLGTPRDRGLAWLASLA